MTAGEAITEGTAVMNFRNRCCDLAVGMYGMQHHANYSDAGRSKLLS